MLHFVAKTDSLSSIPYLSPSLTLSTPQVISDYCKTHHQVKPFSHIVMDLFHDAVNQPEHDDEDNDNDGEDDEVLQPAAAANGAEAEEQRKLLQLAQQKKQKEQQQGDEKYDKTFLILSLILLPDIIKLNRKLNLHSMACPVHSIPLQKRHGQRTKF